MSLVNDALKRARQFQPPTPVYPPPGPQLRPAEPARESKRNLNWVWPVLLGLFAACVFLLGLTLLLARNQAARAREQGAHLTPPSVPMATPALAKPTAPVVVTPAPPTVVSVPAAVPQVAATVPVATNAAPAEVAPPKLSPPKLQAIIFNPRRPSALIGGKTLFLGERIGEWRLQAVTADSATVVRPGQTNILRLD